MTIIDRAIWKAARLFIPAGWELIEAPPVVSARNEGDGRGWIVFGFYLREKPDAARVDTEHLRRK